MHNESPHRIYIDPPPSWIEKSKLILELQWRHSQSRVRADMFRHGCSAWPLREEWIQDFRERVLPHCKGARSEIALMTTETRCTEAEAVGYLVADIGFTLPWIVIEVGASGLLGPSVDLFVADVETQAEEVRRAWVAAGDSIFGTDKHRRPGPGAYNLISHDASFASLKYTWPERRLLWSEVAPEGASTFPDNPEKGTRGWRAYRNQVMNLRENYPALGAAWEAIASDPSLDDSTREYLREKTDQRLRTLKGGE